MSSPTTGLTVYPTPPTVAPSGAAWEVLRYDFTAMDIGSIKGGTTILDEASGGAPLSVTTVNDANYADAVVSAGTGLVFSSINGNLPVTAPGLQFDFSGFSGLDLTTDAVAILIDATVTPLTTDVAGVFAAFYSVADGFNGYHNITGLLYSGGIVGYAHKQGGVVTSPYYPAATNQHFIGLLLDGGKCRATRDATAPADPYAGTSIIVQDASHTGTWSVEDAQDPNSLAKYRAANLGATVRMIGVGGMAGVAAVTFRSLTLYRLPKDAA